MYCCGHNMDHLLSLPSRIEEGGGAPQGGSTLGILCQLVSCAIKFSHQDRSCSVLLLLRRFSRHPVARVRADVAVSPIVSAIIVHRARKQGSSEGVGSQ